MEKTKRTFWPTQSINSGAGSLAPELPCNLCGDLPALETELLRC